MKKLTAADLRRSAAQKKRRNAPAEREIITNPLDVTGLSGIVSGPDQFPFMEEPPSPAPVMPSPVELDVSNSFTISRADALRSIATAAAALVIGPFMKPVSQGELNMSMGSVEDGIVRQVMILSGPTGMPGDGSYTGLGWYHAGWTVGSNTINLGSWKNDVLQVGWDGTSGAIVAGAGAVVLNVDGITGFNQGVPSFGISASDGSAFFASHVATIGIKGIGFLDDFDAIYMEQNAGKGTPRKVHFGMDAGVPYWLAHLIPASTELLVNGDFETGTLSNWTATTTGGATVAAATDKVYQGTTSGKLTIPSGGSAFITSDRIALSYTTQGVIEVSGFMFLETTVSSAGAAPLIVVKFYDNPTAGSLLSSYQFYGSMTGGRWTFATKSLNVPTNAQSCTVALYAAQSEGATLHYWFDNVSVKAESSGLHMSKVSLLMAYSFPGLGIDYGALALDPLESAYIPFGTTGKWFIYSKSTDGKLYGLNGTGTEYQLAYDGGHREVLTAARTYYVRTDGNDSNTGLTNTAGGAFLTIQKAIDVASALDNAGNNVTLQIGNGTYTAANTLKTFLGSGTIIIVGDETTPSNVVVSVTSGTCFTANAILGKYSLRGMQLTTTTSGQCITAANKVVVDFKNIDFAACAGYHIFVATGSLVDAVGNYTISGNATAHLNVSGVSVFRYNATITVTITGTPAFTNFALCASASYLQCNVVPTYSGSATGARYAVTLNGVINTQGGGANFFPGNSAGASATGGQYA